ncbi:MAG: hypothetical protein DWQ19_12750 [Crenarchaeota archaeon]|mgnify:CR=1 FL=1|nr:MAG: hypothetical protein DWQ19_12750 [Thermoproteota archaeon]
MNKEEILKEHLINAGSNMPANLLEEVIKTLQEKLYEKNADVWDCIPDEDVDELVSLQQKILEGVYVSLNESVEFDVRIFVNLKQNEIQIQARFSELDSNTAYAGDLIEEETILHKNPVVKKQYDKVAKLKNQFDERLQEIADKYKVSTKTIMKYIYG